MQGARDRFFPKAAWAFCNLLQDFFDAGATQREISSDRLEAVLSAETSAADETPCCSGQTHRNFLWFHAQQFEQVRTIPTGVEHFFYGCSVFWCSRVSTGLGPVGAGWSDFSPRGPPGSGSDPPRSKHPAPSGVCFPHPSDLGRLGIILRTCLALKNKTLLRPIQKRRKFT